MGFKRKTAGLWAAAWSLLLCTAFSAAAPSPALSGPAGSFGAMVHLKKQPDSVVLPVLMYHHFVPEDDGRLNAQTITGSKFESDLKALSEAGFTAMLPHEVVAAQKTGKFPQKPLMLTMDDGYLSNYTCAYPLLKKYRMKATIFIIGWSVGLGVTVDAPDTLIPHFDMKAAKEMAESGLVSIAPHSYDLHWDRPRTKTTATGVARRLNETGDRYAARMQEDFTLIKNLIERSVGEKVIAYSYPYGIDSLIMRRLLIQNGVLMSFKTGNAFSNITRDGLYGIRRLGVTNNMASDTLVGTIEALIEKAK